MSCFCDLFYVGEEQNQEHDFHSFMDFCSLETVCFNILFKCLYFFHLFHSFSFTEIQITSLFRRIVSYETDLCTLFKLTFEFVSSTHSRSSLWTYYCCYAFEFCNPDKDPLFYSFLITASTFHIIFVRLTCPKARVMLLHNFRRLDCGLARVTCDLECSQRRTSSCVKPDELGCHSVA